MIVDESRGAVGSQQRYEVFRAYCRENHIFRDQVIKRAIFYKGKEHVEAVMPSEDESIDQACQYNIQSEYVEWRDIVVDDKIVGFDIVNHFSHTREQYVLPEYRN